MAEAFAVFSFAIAFILLNQRQLAMWLIFIGLVLVAILMWYHATDMLKINL